MILLKVQVNLIKKKEKMKKEIIFYQNKEQNYKE